MNSKTDEQTVLTELGRLSDKLTTLKLAVEADGDKRMKELAALAQRVADMGQTFGEEIVKPLPRMAERVEELKDAPAMEDFNFAVLRRNAKRGDNLIKTMGMQSALIKVVLLAVAEKSNRLKALDERIRNGSAGEAEVAVAQSRKRHVEEGVKVLRKRLWAVTEDFAKTRKRLMSRIVALSNEVAETLPKNSNMVKCCFSGVNADIETSMRLINEIEAGFKAGEKRLPATAFGGRSK